MRRLTSFVLAGAVLAGGCSASGTGPTPPDRPLRLSVSRVPTLLAGAAMFALRLDNISGSVVNLTFPSSCKVQPDFRDRGGRPVTPVGGGVACLTVITELALQPGVAFIETVTVKAATGPEPSFVILPPGEYTIRARLADATYKLESDPLAFTVQ